MESMDLKIPNVFKPLYDPSRFKLYYGGRGGGKSWAYAQALVLRAVQSKVLILCLRFTDTSTESSTYTLLWETIVRLGLEPRFKKYRGQFVCLNGSKFMFKGLYGATMRSEGLKSFEGVDYCWVEEAQEISVEAFRLLLPTVRKADSELWFSMNRRKVDDVVYASLVNRADAIVRKVNYYDNPFCPDVIFEEAELMKRDNYEEYLHVYEGEPFTFVQTGVIDPSLVRVAMNRDFVDGETDGVLHVGVDVARFGDDRTCLVGRIGKNVVVTKQFTKLNIVEVAGICKDVIKEREACFYIDDVGVGGGLTDILSSEGYSVIAIHNGGSPRNKRIYINKITEIWFEFASILTSIKLPFDDSLFDELISREYTYKVEDGKTKKMVVAKDKHKASLGRSPDYAEALLYAFSDYVINEYKCSPLIEGRNVNRDILPYTRDILNYKAFIQTFL